MMATLGGSSSMDSMAAMTGSSGVFNEMLDDPSALKESYDVVVGSWPKKYDEVILVLQDPETIPDLLVYSLGLRNSDELISMISKIMAQEKVEDISKKFNISKLLAKILANREVLEDEQIQISADYPGADLSGAVCAGHRHRFPWHFVLGRPDRDPGGADVFRP